MLYEYQETLLSVIKEQISDLARKIVLVLGKADDLELPDDFAESMMEDHDDNNDKVFVAG